MIRETAPRPPISGADRRQRLPVSRGPPQACPLRTRPAPAAVPWPEYRIKASTFAPSGGKCRRIANRDPWRTCLPSPSSPLFDSVCLTVAASNLSLNVCRVYRNFYHPVLVRTWRPEPHLGAGVRLCGSSLKFSKLLRSSLPDRRGADRAR